MSILVLFLLFSSKIFAATTFTASNWGTITRTSSLTPVVFSSPQRTGTVSYDAGSYTTSIYSLIKAASVGLPSSTVQGNNAFQYGYFEIDVFGITKPISSASFELFLPSNGLSGSATLETISQSVRLRVSDFNPASFVSFYPDEYPPQYDTLDVVAEGTFSPADQGSLLVLNFSPEGINYLNTQVTGGAPSLKFITEITSSPYPISQPVPNEVVTAAGVFENSIVTDPANIPRLTVTEIPEPSSITLFGLGLFTILIRRHR